MKLIKQSFEILEQKDFSLIGIKKFIERCGRVCYKSEDKITDDSYEKFVDMLEKRDHARPLEFGTVHLKMTFLDFQRFKHNLLAIGMFNNVWIKYIYKEDAVCITTNYRYYLDIVKYSSNVKRYFTEEDNEYYPRRYTVHFITSRGIMDEFRTHVSLSHLAESTRYCNYSKDKFDNQITFVIPYKLDLEEGEYNGTYYKPYCKEDTFARNYLNAERDYLELISNGSNPQQARDVLPLGVKSELISCGFEDAWSNFFYRRCANDAHPMAREIAVPLYKRFKELGYVN